mmetsp:Transcript_105489/g.298112  ORF Transcript_105489/g.298112 Transcript_105489/m.298112 type:complete len:213 (+) Transcript_105489:440-1078(+)
MPPSSKPARIASLSASASARCQRQSPRTMRSFSYGGKGEDAGRLHSARKPRASCWILEIGCRLASPFPPAWRVSSFVLVCAFVFSLPSAFAFNLISGRAFVVAEALVITFGLTFCSFMARTAACRKSSATALAHSMPESMKPSHIARRSTSACARSRRQGPSTRAFDPASSGASKVHSALKPNSGSCLTFVPSKWNLTPTAGRSATSPASSA